MAIGCLGATTAKVAKEAGLEVNVQAPTPETPSMPAALDLFLKENHKKK
jgi:uroporphyrinogen-III synthase